MLAGLQLADTATKEAAGAGTVYGLEKKIFDLEIFQLSPPGSKFGLFTNCTMYKSQFLHDFVLSFAIGK